MVRSQTSLRRQRKLRSEKRRQETLKRRRLGRDNNTKSDEFTSIKSKNFICYKKLVDRQTRRPSKKTESARERSNVREQLDILNSSLSGMSVESENDSDISMLENFTGRSHTDFVAVCHLSPEPNDDDDDDDNDDDDDFNVEVPNDTTNRRRRRHAEVPHRVTYRKGITISNAGLERLSNHPHTCGTLTDLCSFCGALFYTWENITRSGEHTSCCNEGAYSLPQLSPCPTELKNLYTGDGSIAMQFRKNIRYLNSLFAMASFKTSRPIPERRGQGHWSFAVCGQIYHYYDPIIPTAARESVRPKQFYFLDVEEATRKRNVFAQNAVEPRLVEIIEKCLRKHNRYIRAYKTMGEELKARKERNMEMENIVIGLTKEANVNILAAREDPNRIPGRSDIAAIFEGSEPPEDVDLVLYPHRDNDPNPHNRCREIKNLNAMADPMVYPLLFPCGDYGFQTGIKYNSSRGGGNGSSTDDKRVTILQYYRYRLYCRDSFSAIHHGGKLFHQYIVDGWIKCETSRLWWIRQNQRQFRKTAEDTLERFNRNRREGHVGRVTILPSGFPGGERYRSKMYADAMATVARFGKPDLFVTFTCNPNWPEIRGNLLPHQKWEDRPDLICRVFQMKLRAFVDDVVNKQTYGVVVNHQYVVEFQKRGLPHAHIVITFHDDDKLTDAEAVDNVISARIPDKRTRPKLYELVRDYQLHPPCGKLNPNAACVVDGKCVNFYPKPYREETVFAVGRNKRPEYKRPADGREIYVEKWNRSVTNRRVVPYNAYATAVYRSHINFEAVGSLNTITYLHKFIDRGPDTISLRVDRETNVYKVDEVQDYIDSRYVSAMEATWRIMEFKMHGRSHSIVFLPIHLPGERDILYDEEDDVRNVERRLSKNSKLEAWFALNASDVDARRYKYIDVPERYLWDDKNARWKKRSEVSKQFGRLAEISPSDGRTEKFFLRILLKKISGAASFEDLLTLADGTRCATFRESCERRNLIVDESGEFENCLREAARFYPPRQLRRLFALICCHAAERDVAQIKNLWLAFRAELIADFRRRRMMSRIEAIGRCVEILESIVERCRPGVTLADLGIVNIAENDIDDDDDEFMDSRDDSRFDDDETSFARNNVRNDYSVSSLNVDQKRSLLRVLKGCSYKLNVPIPLQVYEDLLSDGEIANEEIADKSKKEHLFYLDGPGGTGKTYFYNTLITVIKNLFKRDVIAVAWTGIAANILIDGTTVHRAFKLPLTLSESSACGWEIQSERSRFIKNAALIVWDEAPMTPKYAFETVDRYLRDIMRRYEPMGGKCCVFGGDFRQILPVVIGGRRNDVLAQTLKASALWRSFVKLRLTENMRVANDPETARTYADLNDLRFDEWLLKLGDGTIPYANLDKKRAAPLAPDDLIEIPERFHAPTIEDLIRFVYRGDYTSAANGARAILCPTNAVVDYVNAKIVESIDSDDSKLYSSEDSYAGEEEGDRYAVTIDLLNSINTQSLPPHELILKRGAIVMLLRNLDVDRGECNGSRLRIVNLRCHTIECELLTGQRRGETIILPRMKIKAEVPLLPKEIVRLQFPVRLAYAMTINKSQGQTMDKVGICLRKPCFAHGQLYVAFSRVGNVDGLKIFIEDSGKQGTFKFRSRRRFTSNVVFPKIVDNDDDDDDIGRNKRKRVVVVDEEAIDSEDDANRNIVVDSDPDYVSDDNVRIDATNDTFLENIDFSKVDKGKKIVKNPANVRFADDVPDASNVTRTKNGNENISVYDRPGTSGVRRPNDRNYSQTYDSDSD